MRGFSARERVTSSYEYGRARGRRGLGGRGDGAGAPGGRGGGGGKDWKSV